MAASVSVRAQAQKDLRRVGPGPERRRVLAGLERLAGEDEALDIKALQGSPGWRRLRIGDYRVLFFVLDQERADRAFVVERIVHRRDLDAAAGGLPD